MTWCLSILTRSGIDLRGYLGVLSSDRVFGRKKWTFDRLVTSLEPAPFLIWVAALAALAVNVRRVAG